MANPHGGSTVLAGAENIIIVPLYALTMVYTSINLTFPTWEYDPDTNEERGICSAQFTEFTLPPYLPPDSPHRIPILFKVVGQIAEEECFLTADGYECPESSGQEDERPHA